MTVERVVILRSFPLLWLLWVFASLEWPRWTTVFSIYSPTTRSEVSHFKLRTWLFWLSSFSQSLSISIFSLSSSLSPHLSSLYLSLCLSNSYLISCACVSDTFLVIHSLLIFISFFQNTIFLFLARRFQSPFNTYIGTDLLCISQYSSSLSNFSCSF